jgi:hypothetical protein
MLRETLRVAAFIIVFLFVIFLFSRGHIYSRDELSYGVTFSQSQTEKLGLEPEKLFAEILYDLGAKKLRLSAYWNEIESARGTYDFSHIDWQIDAAEQAGASVILAVGIRLPRWPECHYPDWAKGLAEKQIQESALEYIEATIVHYKDKNNIIAWQIENEPFLPYFGECPEPDSVFLDREIALARGLDSRPIIITDSGELSVWIPAARRADIFGTTMYRDTYSSKFNRYAHYPSEPGFFRFKKNIAGLFAHPQDWIVIELAAEPWGPRPFQDLSPAERSRTMDFDKFKDMIEFSSRTGFKEFYLWGAEWWAWEREKRDNPALWNYAKELFNQDKK